jgi:hypothetical protein
MDYFLLCAVYVRGLVIALHVGGTPLCTVHGTQRCLQVMAVIVIILKKIQVH